MIVGERLVVDVLGLGRTDVAAHGADAVAGRDEGRRDIRDLELDRAGPDDLRVVDGRSDAVLRDGRGRAPRRRPDRRRPGRTGSPVALSPTALPTGLRFGAEALPAQAASKTAMEAISAIRAIDGRMVRM